MIDVIAALGQVRNVGPIGVFKIVTDFSQFLAGAGNDLGASNRSASRDDRGDDQQPDELADQTNCASVHDALPPSVGGRE